MPLSVRARLSIMMALLYAVQGAWWPLLALHLGDLGLDGRERSWIFAAYPLATLVMSLGAGALVDRLTASERYLTFCYALGIVPLVAMAAGGSVGLTALFLAYWAITAPTYGIGNAIAFRNLPRVDSGFGRVRMWGTVGWMVVGWVVSALMAGSGGSRPGRGAHEAFWVAAALSAALAWFATRLPDTPPLARGGRASAIKAAADLMKEPGVGRYLLIAFGVHLTTPFVYQVIPTYLEARGLPRAWAATAMTLGQWPEVLMLAALPWLLRRLGVKATLLIGMVAWLVRFGTLAMGAPLWLAVAGIPLHGVGTACFTVGGQVFLDSRAPGDRRAGAQALNMAVTSGLGSLVGSLLAGDLAARWGGNSPAVFVIPCSIHVGLIGFSISAFRPDLGVDRRRRAVPPGRMSPREEACPVAVGIGVAMESADG